MDDLRRWASTGALIGLRLGRTPEYVIAYLALAGLGATSVPFDDDTPDAEVVAEAQQLGLSAIISNRPLVSPGGCDVHLVCQTSSRRGAIPWVAPGGRSRLPAPANVGPDAPLVLLKTSGSTARPKRVLLLHRNALASSRAHRESVGHGSGEVSLVALPMSFGYCHTTQLVAQIDAGGTLALLPGTFLPRVFADAVAASGATTTTLVPAMLAMLARALPAGREQLRSLRSIVFGGAPMEPEQFRTVGEFLPWVELIQTYGQTEAGPRLTTLRAADAIAHPGSVGRAVPGMRIAVVSPAGEPLAAGQIGEITAKGAGIMHGYYRDPAATSEVLRDGWLRTGDLGWLGDDGFVWLAGRLRNLVITAGRKVVAEEVEAQLRQMPGVADAAVFGEADELRGESVHAVIVPVPGMTPTSGTVRAFLGDRLEPHKLPRRVSVVSSLPRTSNGKLDRSRLSSAVAARGKR